MTEEPDPILDLSALALPRKPVKLAGERIVTLAAPQELSTMENTQVRHYQKQMAALIEKAEPSRATQHKDYLDKQLRVVVRDTDEETLASLTDVEKDLLMEVFFGRQLEWRRSSVKLMGHEEIQTRAEDLAELLSAS